MARAARWVRDQRVGGRLGPVVDRLVPLPFEVAAQALVGVRCTALLDDPARRRPSVAAASGCLVFEGPVIRHEPAPGRADWPYAAVLARLEGRAARGPLRRSVAVEVGIEPWSDQVSNVVVRLRRAGPHLGFTPAAAGLLAALDDALVATSVDLAVGRLGLLDALA